MLKCPVPGCKKSRGGDHVMCRDHWFKVSKKTRDEVWAQYREAPGQHDHLRAIRTAIREASAA